jgi:hypothetical protein
MAVFLSNGVVVTLNSVALSDHGRLLKKIY